MEDIKKYFTIQYFEKTAKALKDYGINDAREMVKRYLGLLKHKLGTGVLFKTADEKSFKEELVKYIWLIINDVTTLDEGEVYGDVAVGDYADEIIAMVKKHFGVSKIETITRVPLSAKAVAMLSSMSHAKEYKKIVRVPIMIRKYKKVGE